MQQVAKPHKGDPKTACSWPERRGEPSPGSSASVSKAVPPSASLGTLPQCQAVYEVPQSTPRCFGTDRLCEEKEEDL